MVTKTNPPLAEGELTEDEDDYDVILEKQIEDIKRHFKLGYLTEWRDVIDKAKEASGFEPVGTLKEQIRQMYNYVVGPMQERHRVAKGVSLNDFAMDELLLIIDQYFHTADMRRGFGVEFLSNAKNLSNRLIQYVQGTICAQKNKQWQAACADPILWKRAYESEKKQLLDVIAKEDAGEAAALRNAWRRSKSWLHDEYLKMDIIEGIRTNKYVAKPRDVKRMFLARNGLDIDNVVQSIGLGLEDPKLNSKLSYAMGLVQLYGAWKWLTLHMREWPALTDDDLRNLRSEPAQRKKYFANSLEREFGPMEAWNTSELTSLDNLFNNDKAVGWQNTPLGLWDVSKVEDFAYLFKGAAYFNQPLNEWDVSSGRQFQGMFENTRLFNQPLNKWNVSKGGFFHSMFKNAQSFNQPLDRWVVSNGTRFEQMFVLAVNFRQDLSNWVIKNDLPRRIEFAEQSFPLEYLPEAIRRNLAY
jgi:hypothetical protein